ncbi:hypothetical protein QAD02_009836 [Eretmocerus hayati]|uniref:Uncharacterized protein n=1 Tax=Eretmocerus hayati TaxID=131215 RepID=A0ACC2NB60_9HYME|nr:hypothetical protein QAD02_009836 [Eretmocerus hayati]
MDLRVAQFSAHTNRQLDSAATPAGLDRLMPPLLALSAIVGAIFFAFLILLWLRQQMSREKDVEDGDRRGLVEEGTVCPKDDSKINKSKLLTEAKWVTGVPVPRISITEAPTEVTTSAVQTTAAVAPAATDTDSEAVREISPSFDMRCPATPISSVVPTTPTTMFFPDQQQHFSMLSACSRDTSPIVVGMVPKRSPRRESGSRRTRSLYSQSQQSSLAPDRRPGCAVPTTCSTTGSAPRRGLLERRGSSANLTIDLVPSEPLPRHPVTPTRERSDEEYLLSGTCLLNRQQLRDSLRDPSALRTQFMGVPLNLPDEVGVRGSEAKDRYRKVLPNPRSRVVLPGSDDPFTSYINANRVRGYDDDTRYIATQGPLTHTIADFWSMAWAERSSAIVMMTRLFEAACTKCEPYFPLEINSRVQAGPFTVVLNSMDTRGGYTVRDLEIRLGNDKRTIQHYWYDSWMDHAVPAAADALVGLAAEINTLPGPIIVHCSAGIGRTGCFIALATGMTQLLREGGVDVLGILCQMRYDRGGMIQTADQYEFVHRALCLFEETLERKSSKDNDRKDKPK